MFHSLNKKVGGLCRLYVFERGGERLQNAVHIIFSYKTEMPNTDDFSGKRALAAGDNHVVFVMNDVLSHTWTRLRRLS